MDSSKKIKKNYKLMGTESDPIIIAQRLLNLYRQLHIFSPEKKEAYNQMLMEQTPEVKRTLGALPGGIVVQQYLADIEKEAGVAVEEFDNEGVVLTEDEEEQEAPVNYKMPIQPIINAPATDPKAIKEIVEAFKEAMITSDKNRREDTKELAQTIVALQSKLTQTIISKVETGAPGTISQSPAIDATQIEDIIKGISRAQAELIKDLTQTQTQELSKLISNVLKEIQQMSNQTLIDAVKTVHQENMDFFKNQILSNVSMVPMSSKIAEAEALYDFEQSKQDQISLDDFEGAEPVSLDNAEERQPKKNKKVEKVKKKENQDNLKKTSKSVLNLILQRGERSAASERSMPAEEIVESKKSEPADSPKQENDIFQPKEENRETQNPIEESVSSFYEEVQDQENQAQAVSPAIEEKISDFVPEEMSVESENTDILEGASPQITENTTKEEVEESPSDDIKEEAEKEEYQNEIKDIAIDETKDDTLLPIEEENTFSVEPVNIENFEPVDLEALGQETTKKESTTFQEQKDQENISSGDEGEGYEWEYVEDDGSVQPEDTAQTESSEDGEYEWEYVEDDGAAEPEDIAQAESSEDGEYEWEYVEDDGPEGTAEDGEYEWEYVEDDGSEEFGDEEGMFPVGEEKLTDYMSYNAAAPDFFLNEGGGNNEFLDDVLPQEHTDRSPFEEENFSVGLIAENDGREKNKMPLGENDNFMLDGTNDFPDNVELPENFGLVSNDDE